MKRTPRPVDFSEAANLASQSPGITDSVPSDTYTIGRTVVVRNCGDCGAAVVAMVVDEGASELLFAVNGGAAVPTSLNDDELALITVDEAHVPPSAVTLADEASP